MVPIAASPTAMRNLEKERARAGGSGPVRCSTARIANHGANAP